MCPPSGFIAGECIPVVGQAGVSGSVFGGGIVGSARGQPALRRHQGGWSLVSIHQPCVQNKMPLGCVHPFFLVSFTQVGSAPSPHPPTSTCRPGGQRTWQEPKRPTSKPRRGRTPQQPELPRDTPAARLDNQPKKGVSFWRPHDRVVPATRANPHDSPPPPHNVSAKGRRGVLALHQPPWERQVGFMGP